MLFPKLGIQGRVCIGTSDQFVKEKFEQRLQVATTGSNVSVVEYRGNNQLYVRGNNQVTVVGKDDTEKYVLLVFFVPGLETVHLLFFVGLSVNSRCEGNTTWKLVRRKRERERKPNKKEQVDCFKSRNENHEEDVLFCIVFPHYCDLIVSAYIELIVSAILDHGDV